MNILTLKKNIPILSLIIAITGLIVFAPGEPTALQCFLASLILVFGFFPALYYMRKNEPGIPFIPLFGIIYSIYYALPIFILKEYVTATIYPPTDSLVKALSLATVGLLALIFAYYKIPGKSIGRFIPKVSISWDVRKATLWAIRLGIIGVVFSYIRLAIDIPASLAQIVLFLAELLTISIGILLILQLKGHLGKAGKIWLWLVFMPLIFLIRLGYGAIGPVLLIAMFLLLTYWCFRRRIPWKLAVGMVLLFILFSSVKLEFRTFGRGGIYSGKNPIERSILFTQLIFTKKEVFNKGCIVAAKRTSHCLMTFAHVVDITPETVPYWRGKSYSALLWVPIPRIIFPWKPTLTLGQEFGHRYNFLHDGDYTTSYNLPQLVEMYVNFGVIGIIIGMFIMGIIYRSLYEMFCHPKAGEGGLIIGLFVFSRLTIIEADFSVVFGIIPYYIILLIMINWLMKGDRQHSG